jgi:hypothetical protein
VEFSHLDVVVVIIVYLREYFIQSESTLVDYLKQVVEDLILSVVNVSVLLLVDSSFNVVFGHELIELIILNDTVLVLIDLLEESSDFILLKTHVEVA